MLHVVVDFNLKKTLLNLHFLECHPGFFIQGAVVVALNEIFL